MHAIIFNFLLSRLKRSCRDMRTRMLRIRIRRIAADLQLQREFEQLALTSIAQSLKSGISERTHNKLTKTLTKFAKVSNELGNAPPELLLVYTELAKVTPTPKPPPQSPVKFTPEVFLMNTGSRSPARETEHLPNQQLTKDIARQRQCEHTPERTPERPVNTPSGVHPNPSPMTRFRSHAHMPPIAFDFRPTCLRRSGAKKKSVTGANSPLPHSSVLNGSNPARANSSRSRDIIGFVYVFVLSGR